MRSSRQNRIGKQLRRTLGLLGLSLFVAASAQASPILSINEFTWDSTTGVANISGTFDVDSYTGEKWRLTFVEIQVGSTIYSTSLAPYTEYTSVPFSYSFEDIAITPAALTIGNAYEVGIKMQRYFTFMSGWDSGTVFRSSTVVTAVPEPTTALLVGFGLAGLAMRRSRVSTRSA